MIAVLVEVFPYALVIDILRILLGGALTNTGWLAIESGENQFIFFAINRTV